MDFVQIKVLETLYENIEDVIKHRGWSESKIRRFSSFEKGELRVALALLSDKKLITTEKEKIKLGKENSIEVKYRINQKGIDEYKKISKPISCWFFIHKKRIINWSEP